MNYLRNQANKAIKIYDFIQEQGLRHRVNRDEIFICCPFHKDNTPSCSISLTKKIFQCFGCRINGDYVYLLSKILRKSIDEVINTVCVENKIDYPKTLGEVVKKEEPDFFLEELKQNRDIEFLTWILYTKYLHIAQRIYYKSSPIDEEAAFYYRMESLVENQCHRLWLADDGMKRYCLHKQIAFPHASALDFGYVPDLFGTNNFEGTWVPVAD